VIDRPLSLVGAGVDATHVISSVGDKVVQYNGKGCLAAREICFEHQGKDYADVVDVRHGEVYFQFCRYTGAVFDTRQRKGGCGLVLTGSARGTIRDCVSDKNQLHGIVVASDAEPTLENNHCFANEGVGICYVGQASGIAKNNDCYNNGQNGIRVQGDAKPTLVLNKCGGNQKSGILFWGNAHGIAESNDCQANQRHGILLDGAAAPVVRSNVCKGNAESGIYSDGVSRADIIHNQCEGNKQLGLYVSDTANPWLGHNHLHQNGEDLRDERPWIKRQWKMINYFTRIAMTLVHRIASRDLGVAVEDDQLVRSNRNGPGSSSRVARRGSGSSIGG
jgi:parallel beta-helix repeat protein